MAALCKASTKSTGIGLSITAVCKNAGKKTLGQDDFFVVFSAFNNPCCTKKAHILICHKLKSIFPLIFSISNFVANETVIVILKNPSNR